MLDRYRKPGGFLQLVQLIETCDPSKQEKFLKIIRYEAPLWAAEVKKKTLDIERIYSWHDDSLAEIIGTVQDLCLAVAIYAAAEPLKTRLLGMVSHGRRRKIDDLLLRNPPSAGEIATMHTKIVETVRKMAIDGFLRFDKVDPNLAIDDNIEERLARASGPASSSPAASAPAGTTSAPLSESDSPAQPAEVDTAAALQATQAALAAADAPNQSEIVQLKRKLLALSKENAILRNELGIARSKLDQIKKIA